MWKKSYSSLAGKLLTDWLPFTSCRNSQSGNMLQAYKQITSRVKSVVLTRFAVLGICSCTWAVLKYQLQVLVLAIKYLLPREFLLDLKSIAYACFFLLFWLAFILTLQINNFICDLTCNFDLLRRCNAFYTWQHESCSIWSHATTSVPVYDNCTGCQSLNESQALFSRPQRSS